MPESAKEWDRLLDLAETTVDKTLLYGMYQELREVIAEFIGDPEFAEFDLRMPDGSIKRFKNRKEAAECLEKILTV